MQSRHPKRQLRHLPTIFHLRQAREIAKNKSHEKMSIHQRILGIQTLMVRTKAMEYQRFHIKIAILGCSPPDLMAS